MTCPSPPEESSYLFFFLIKKKVMATLQGMQDLTFLTMYQTRTPCIGSAES